MSDLSTGERRKLEKLFGMGDGYVLDFSDKTFADFLDNYKVEIDDKRYYANGSSKAKRMRTHWDLDDNPVVGRVIEGLINYGAKKKGCIGDSKPELIEDGRKIAQRLLGDQPVIEMDALAATTDKWDFGVVEGQVREAINNNQPEAALDRLHTFVIKFVRNVCEIHGIKAVRDKPLHSMFGEYVNALHNRGHLESIMTVRILKSSISVLDAFNDVRNNKSLAHDNPILNYEESRLIFNHVAAVIRFVKSLQTKIQTAETDKGREDDIPF